MRATAIGAAHHAGQGVVHVVAADIDIIAAAHMLVVAMMMHYDIVADHIMIVYDNIATANHVVIHDDPVAIDHPVAINHYRTGVVNDDIPAVAIHVDRTRGHIGPRRNIGRRLHDAGGRQVRRHPGNAGLLEQRLAMAVAVEVKPHQIGPGTLEDHQRLILVPAPEIAHVVALGVDHPELVLLLGTGGNVEGQLDVQIFLRTRLGGGGRTRPGHIELRYLGNVPRRVVRNRRPWLGQQERCAEQHRRVRQNQSAASHENAPWY
jgi:hypothetical protein